MVESVGRLPVQPVPGRIMTTFPLKLAIEGHGRLAAQVGPRQICSATD